MYNKNCFQLFFPHPVNNQWGAIWDVCVPLLRPYISFPLGRARRCYVATMIDWPKKALFPLLYCRLYVLYCTTIVRNESIHISWNSSAILLQLLLPIWPFLQFRGKISALQCYHFYSKVNLWQGAGTVSQSNHTSEVCSEFFVSQKFYTLTWDSEIRATLGYSSCTLP